MLLVSLVSAQPQPGNMKPGDPDKLPDVPRQVPGQGVLLIQKATHTDALAHYRQVALQNQPALTAARTSLGLAQTRVESIHKLGGIATLVRKDLDIRKEQVQFGVQAAQAQLSVAAWETLYAVTRNYWTAVYAQEQLLLAEESLDPEKEGSLPWLRNTMNDLYEQATRKDLREWSLKNIDVAIEGVRARMIEAKVGMKRAVAAMREAMGVPHDYPIVIPKEARLPWIEISPCLADVVQAAQERRGEITQAMIFKEITGLEIQAQGKAHPWSMQGETFAASSDLHVQSVPNQIANGEYSPGAIGPEMPGKLAGYRSDRVTQATLYNDRACSVVEKTRQLMILQAEDAFWKFDRATEEVAAYRKALKVADQTKEQIANEFRPIGPLGARPNLDDIMGAGLKSATFRSALNQARYERLLALTYLERVTAGGVNPGFDGPLPLEEPKQKEEKKPNGPENGKNGMKEKQPADRDPVPVRNAPALSQGPIQIGPGGNGKQPDRELPVR
jgi:outer membrane protein TolC